MNKKVLSERDICSKCIDPAFESAGLGTFRSGLHYPALDPFFLL